MAIKKGTCKCPEHGEFDWIIKYIGNGEKVIVWKNNRLENVKDYEVFTDHIYIVAVCPVCYKEFKFNVKI